MGDLTCSGVDFVLVVVSPLLVLPKVTLSPVVSQDFLGSLSIDGDVHLTQLTIKFLHVVLGVKWSRNKVSIPFHVFEVAIFQHLARSFNSVHF